MSDQLPKSEGFLNVNVNYILGSAGDAVPWVFLGEFAGHIVGLVVPDILISDGTIGHLGGLLFAALYGLRVFTRFKTHRSRNLSDCLSDAERLLRNGTIDEEEYKTLRVECIERYSTARRENDEDILYKKRGKNQGTSGGHE